MHNSARAAAERSKSRLRRQGAATIYLIVAAVALFGLASLAADFGRVQLVRAELQQTADLSARAGAAEIFWGVSRAENAAIWYAAANEAGGETVALNAADNLQLGQWKNGAFTVLTGSARTNANAMRVTIQRKVPLYLGAVVGMPYGNASVTAIAMQSTLPHGIVGIDQLNVNGGAFVDSYSSYDGAYSLTQTNAARVTSNGDIILSGGPAIIRGTANAGPGRSVTPTSSVTGSTDPLPELLDYPNVDPANAASNNINHEFGAYINGYRDVNVSSQVNVEVDGGVYYLNSLTISGQATLTFTGPAVVYVTGSVNLSGGTNVFGNKPANLRLRVIGSGVVTISGSNALYCDLYAPQSAVDISGTGGVYGAVVGRTLVVRGGGGAHHDTSMTTPRATTLVR